jgi:nitrate reductase NapAB chaperone NapD
MVSVTGQVPHVSYRLTKAEGKLTVVIDYENTMLMADYVKKS